MRYSIIAINLALCLSTTTALPFLQIRSEPAKKPQYSVVPLEPGSGGSPPAGGHPAGDKTVTVVQTVVQPPVVETKYVTITPDAQTVTKAVPTTVVSTVEGSVASVKTITVVSTQSPPPPTGTSVISSLPSSSVLNNLTSSLLSSTDVHSQSGVRGTQATPLTTPASTTSRTYDNGMWHTTYPPWNATTATGRYRL